MSDRLDLDAETLAAVDLVAGYVVQRAALAARAARLAYGGAGVGFGQDDETSPEGMELLHQGLALTAATNIHPDLLDMFASSALEALQKTRTLSLIARGHNVSLGQVSAAITRDLGVLNAAQGVQGRLSEEDFEILRMTRTTDIGRAAGGDALRYLVCMPAVYLAALEQEWTSAQRALAEVFDHVPSAGVTVVEEQRQQARQLEKRVEGLEQAHDDLGEDVHQIQTAVSMSAASLGQVRPAGRGEGRSA